MKVLKTELRMWFAEKLLSWSFDATPRNEEGQKLRNYISTYFLEMTQNKP